MKTLKRTTEPIFANGGFIRKLDNMGPKNLPFKVSEHGLVNKTGHAFIITADVAPKHISEIREEYSRDVDIIRCSFFRKEDPEPFECTLHEELQPPAYRKEVIEMMRIAQRGQKEKYPHNSGLKYYPFQK